MLRLSYMGILAWAAWAQVPGTGVTVTVSRTVTVPVTEARFEIVAQTPTEVPFGEVLLALQGAGVTDRDIYSIDPSGLSRGSGLVVIVPPGLNQRPARSITWTFVISTPNSEMNATLARLTAAAVDARTASAGRVNMRYRLLSQGPSRADLEEASRRVLPQLWNDARTRAVALAAAAGTRLEGLGGMRNYGSYNSFSFRGGLGAFNSESVAPMQFQRSFSLTAQFGDRLPPGAEGIVIWVGQPELPKSHIHMTVNLNGPLGMTLADAVAQLRSLGVTEADAVSAAMVTPRALTGQLLSADQTQWSFVKLVPLNQLSLTLTAIEALEQSFSARPAVISVETSFADLVASPAEVAAAAARTVASGVAQGRREAQALARAAGFDAGDLVSIEDGQVGDYSPFYLYLRFALKK